MFNNNHWFMGTRDEEVWADIGPDTAYPGDLDGQSHILRYLVDENAGTFSEDLRVDVAYSSVVSNVQRIGGDSLENPMVVNSGKANEIGRASCRERGGAQAAVRHRHKTHVA